MLNARAIFKILSWILVFLILPFVWISIQVIEQLPRKGFPQNLYDTTLGFLFLPGWPIILTCSIIGLLTIATGITGFMVLISKKKSNAATSPLSTDVEHKHNLRSILDQVEARWISGVLEESLPPSDYIKLSLAKRRDAVAIPGKPTRQQVDRDELLGYDITITQVYDKAGHKLLILGETGSGKTTLLLKLARDLLDRARGLLDRALQSDTHPSDKAIIPIVFNLSS
jgi:ABC-type multidrug transport system fused ATPase/permease subunit